MLKTIHHPALQTLILTFQRSSLKESMQVMVEPQNGHQALYISFHQPTRGRIYDFYEQAPLQLQSKCTLLFVV